MIDWAEVAEAIGGVTWDYTSGGSHRNARCADEATAEVRKLVEAEYLDWQTCEAANARRVPGGRAALRENYRRGGFAS